MLEALRQSGVVLATLRFLYQLLEAFVWVYENVVRPITRPFWRAARWVYWRYRAIWDKWVYDAAGYFSKTRAGLLLTATLAFMWLLPNLLGLTYTTVLFATTVSRDTVYLTFSQEIYPDDDIHSVKGCEGLPCTDANAVYYRIHPSWFNQAWSILWRHNLFYPDYVAAAVPPGMSKCTVLTYGFRGKFLMRNYNVYPDLLEVSCEAVRGA